MSNRTKELKKKIFLFDPQTDIIRIHVTMVINNPGNVITEKNTWYNCNKKPGSGDSSKTIIFFIEKETC